MMTDNIETAPLVRLGDYIEQTDERNSDLAYGIDDVRGISTEKKFIETKANLDGVSLSSYKIVPPGEFVYVADTSRRGEKIALALNDSKKSYLVSSIYTTFKSSDKNILLPEYLYLLLSRSEFDRYSRFNSWGSARETFDWSEMCRLQIPLPSIETQKSLVAVYNGLKELAQENEKLLEPLSQNCQAFIVDCKNKYQSKRLGEMIEESKRRNEEEAYGVDFLRGVTSAGKFDESKANTDGLDFSNYKIVSKNDFAYNPSRINVGSIALNLEEKCIVSPMYIVFKITYEKLLPEYLKLWFSRKEFQRSTLFYAMGSVRDTFDFNLMQDVLLPLPPLEIQQKIVDLYNCCEECKRIANEAREKIKKLCPALIQKAAHSR